jgi:hypothetical protein
MKVNFKRMITVLAATAMCAVPMTSAMSASAAPDDDPSESVEWKLAERECRREWILSHLIEYGMKQKLKDSIDDILNGGGGTPINPEASEEILAVDIAEVRLTGALEKELSSSALIRSHSELARVDREVRQEVLTMR